MIHFKFPPCFFVVVFFIQSLKLLFFLFILHFISKMAIVVLFGMFHKNLLQMYEESFSALLSHKHLNQNGTIQMEVVIEQCKYTTNIVKPALLNG